MKKIIAILVVLFLVCCICAAVIIFVVVPQLNFSGKSVSTVNGKTEVRYSADIYYKESNEKIDDVYETLNSWKVAESAESVSKTKISAALDKLAEIKTFRSQIVEVRGKDVNEFNQAFDKWIADYESYLKGGYTELAEILGEDGKADTEAEYNEATTVLEKLNKDTDKSTTEINNAVKAFYEVNN